MPRWPWLLLIIGAIALVFIVRRDPPAPEMPEALGRQPDVYMEGTVVTQYQSNGSIQYRLASKEARHFQRDRLTRFTEPRLLLRSPSEPPWSARAQSGYVRVRETPDGDQRETVYLEGDVVLRREHPDGDFLELATSALYVYPERRYAETDRPVIIRGHAGRTRAHGLKGDLDRGFLKLESSADQRVHTIVPPELFQ